MRAQRTIRGMGPSSSTVEERNYSRSRVPQVGGIFIKRTHSCSPRDSQSNGVVIPKAEPGNLLVLALATTFARTLALLAGRTKASVPTQSFLLCFQRFTVPLSSRRPSFISTLEKIQQGCAG